MNDNIFGRRIGVDSPKPSGDTGAKEKDPKKPANRLALRQINHPEMPTLFGRWSTLKKELAGGMGSNDTTGSDGIELRQIEAAMNTIIKSKGLTPLTDQEWTDM